MQKCVSVSNAGKTCSPTEMHAKKNARNRFSEYEGERGPVMEREKLTRDVVELF
jgi:hypothetical protein